MAFNTVNVNYEPWNAGTRHLETVGRALSAHDHPVEGHALACAGQLIANLVNECSSRHVGINQPSSRMPYTAPSAYVRSRIVRHTISSASTCDGLSSVGPSGSTSGISVQPAMTQEAPPRSSRSACWSRRSAALCAPSVVRVSACPACMDTQIVSVTPVTIVTVVTAVSAVTTFTPIRLGTDLDAMRSVDRLHDSALVSTLHVFRGDEPHLPSKRTSRYTSRHAMRHTLRHTIRRRVIAHHDASSPITIRRRVIAPGG